MRANFGLEAPTPGRGLDAELFSRCMNGHDWSQDPEGFAVPDGEAINMGY